MCYFLDQLDMTVFQPSQKMFKLLFVYTELYSLWLNYLVFETHCAVFLYSGCSCLFPKGGAKLMKFFSNGTYETPPPPSTALKCSIMLFFVTCPSVGDGCLTAGQISESFRKDLSSRITLLTFPSVRSKYGTILILCL